MEVPAWEKRKRRADRETEKGLEVSVFGDDAIAEKFGKEGEPQHSVRQKRKATALFEDEAEGGEEVEHKGAAEEEAAWHDSDDEDIEVDLAEAKRLRKLRKDEDETVISGAEYEKRLRRRVEEKNPTLSWAMEEEEEGGRAEAEEKGELALTAEESSVLRQTGALTTSSGLLPRGTLDIARVKDANFKSPAKGLISALDFHPSGQLLLAGSLDKKVKLFQVDGSRNHKVRSVHFDDLPVHAAKFTNGGNTIVAAGRRKHFYLYDVVEGRARKVPGLQGREEKSLEDFAVGKNSDIVCFYGNAGTLILVSTKSGQYIGELKMNGSVKGASFMNDGNQLMSASKEGEVYLWDLRTQSCIHRIQDQGNSRCSALAVSPTGNEFAVGSKEGIVSTYASSSLHPPLQSSMATTEPWSDPFRDPFLDNTSKPAPLKTFDNLTTTITTLQYSHDGSMLAMGSRTLKDQLRLVHTPSRTVFSNWPTPSTPIHYLSTLAFSPNGGFLAIGNDRGRVLLYRLNHYSKAQSSLYNVSVLGI